MWRTGTCAGDIRKAKLLEICAALQCSLELFFEEKSLEGSAAENKSLSILSNSFLCKTCFAVSKHWLDGRKSVAHFEKTQVLGGGPKNSDAKSAREPSAFGRLTPGRAAAQCKY